jgi:sterol desaturase/sphingolipid hydroxylase (fatty acid hydroxylase superfamily)
MDEQLISLAVPLFVVAIVLEFVLNRRHLGRTGQVSPTGGTGGYRLADTLADLGAGVGQQAFDPLLRVVGVAAYAGVAQQGTLLQLDPRSPWTWLLGMVSVDFAYYWFHRASHRSNVWWAVHHVHHSSEEYNFAVALRQPWFEKLVDIPFYLPLAVLGLPVEVYLVCFTVNLIYQFFVHTRWVPKLGPLEWLLSTPSAHRVHHAVNPAYIDRNYGGILIVWDRLFGTYAAESAEPVYGTVTPLASWSAPWANAAPWLDLWRKSAARRRWPDKLWTWLGPPEWRPAEEGGVVIIPEPVGRRAYDPPLPAGGRLFATAAFLALMALSVGFLQVQRQLNLSQLLAYAAGTCAWLGAVGAALEGRKFLVPLTVGATFGLAVAWPLWLGWPLPAVAALAVLAAALVVLALRVRPVSD